MIILGIETSCDETAAAVVVDGREVRASVIHSQIALHQPFGGVVPELASRRHVDAIVPVTRQALADAGLAPGQLDAIAVTQGPGLIGALLVGVSFAKALADSLDLPLIPVRHLDGHVAANYISHPSLEPPFVCLIVSGGHTSLEWIEREGPGEVLARTRDDAAGEAFDKLARAMGLGYPGGPAISRLAEGGDPAAYRFSLPRFDDDSLDFSFSGLKTQGLEQLRRLDADDAAARRDLAASYQAAIVEQLTRQALEGLARAGSRRLALAGGVAANAALRRRLSEEAEARGIEVILPEARWCTDNAAMIAAAAYGRPGLRGPELWALDAVARDQRTEAR